MEQTPQFDSLRLVGKISLWFSLVAFLGLAVVVILAGVAGDDYLSNIRSLAATRDRLPVIMLVGGLVLAVGTGLTTWVITLYSTFRVTGPLFRFARNLEAGIASGKVPAIKIRGSDYLQPECELLQQGVAQLYHHYRTIDAQAVAALSALQQGDKRGVETSLAELKKQQGRIRYDHQSH